MNSLEFYNGKPLAEQVADYILNYIIDNSLEVGAKIPNEFELGKMINVSRTTIREAIKILVSRQILEIRRGAGTFVSERQGITDDPLGLTFVKDKTKLALDLVSVRLMLEPEIAMMAADHATPEQIEEMRLQCSQIEELIQSGRDHMEADIRLHTLIASCSGNSVVEKLVPDINSSIAVFVDVTNRALGQETIETHREIVNCIAERGAEGAKCAMYLHLIYNRRVFRQLENEEKKLR